MTGCRPVCAVEGAARRREVHGPRDWKHFNRAGYETLARAVVERVRRSPGLGRG